MNRLTFKEDTHEYFYDGKPIPSVTTILSDVGMYPSFDHLPPEKSQWYRDRGTAVHLACHYLDNDELDESTVSEEILPYVQGYKLFKKNWKVEGIESEKMVCDTRYWYAGTIDKILVCIPPPEYRLLGGPSEMYENILFNIKAGGKENGYQYQTAGYGNANGTPGIRRAGLYLNDLGDYEVDFHTGRDDLHSFLSAVNVFHCKRRK